MLEITEETVKERLLSWLNEEVEAEIPGKGVYKITRSFRISFGLLVTSDEDLSKEFEEVVSSTYDDLSYIEGMEVICPGINEEIFSPKLGEDSERLAEWMREVING